MASWDVVLIAFPPILIGTFTLYFFARHLNVLVLGDEPAQQLGIDAETVKRNLLILVSLVAGTAVAFSGIIGFVGLIIPHMMRLVVGPNHRILLPVAALSGGIFLIWTDALARTIIAPAEIPVGIITAFCGAPFFIYLLRKNKRDTWM
jgi:iron complex transport system permease protein